MKHEKKMEQIIARERKLIEEVGHVIRYVFNEYKWEDHEFPSIYTYGLKETYGHEEIECVLPCCQEAAMYLLNSLAKRIKNGYVFEPDVTYQLSELNGIPFYFIPHVQKGSQIPVLRVILADENLLLPEDEGCHPIYALQPFIGSETEEFMVH